MSDLHFDPHAFAGRRHFAVEAEFTQNGWSSNGISGDDYTRMATVNPSVSRRCKRWTPAFAASSEQLRAVLLERGRLYISSTHSESDWRAINARATEKALNPESFPNCPAHKRREHEAHAAVVKRAGGYLELQAAIAYRAWLLGQNSVQVGESLGLTPVCVRKNLNRLSEVARELGYETFPRHHSFNPKAARHASKQAAAERRARKRAVEARKARKAAIAERNARIVAYYNAHAVGGSYSARARAVGAEFGITGAAVRHILERQ